VLKLKCSRAYLLAFALVILSSCTNKSTEETPTEESVTVSVEAPVPSIPDPSGSYTDPEGALSFTFFSTGKFYQELMGETTYGTWRRSGDEVEMTFDDGASAEVVLGEAYVEFNGMRLSK
jgi:hypothetical protein